MKKSTYLAFAVIIGVFLLAFLAPIVFFHRVEPEEYEYKTLVYELAGVSETHKYAGVQSINVGCLDRYSWRHDLYIAVSEADVDSVVYTADANVFKNVSITCQGGELSIILTHEDADHFGEVNDAYYVNTDALDNMGVILVPRGTINRIAGPATWTLQGLTGDSLTVLNSERVIMEDCRYKTIDI